MPAKWEFSLQTKAPLPKVIDYFSHPENLPNRHPDFVKATTVKSREGDQIMFDQEMKLMGKTIKSSNRMDVNRAQNMIQINTLEGDGKGSKITMNFLPSGMGTEIKYNAEMELGALGFFAKGPAKSAMEKVATEDASFLDNNPA